MNSFESAEPQFESNELPQEMLKYQDKKHQELIQKWESSGVMGRMAERARRSLSAMVLMSTLSIAACGKADMLESPNEKENQTAASVEKNNTEKAIEFLNSLTNLPNNPNVPEGRLQEVVKLRAAKDMIYGFALQRSGMESGVITRDMLEKAVEELNGVSGEFADRYYGDNDGKVEATDMQKLNENTKENPGLRALWEITNNLGNK